jgi:CreA protein
MKWLFIAAATVVMSVHSAQATDLDCISTTFNALSPNDKVCVSVFEDPQVPGVVCHISQARKGGWGQPLGLNEDPSNFSISCRQIGPVDVDLSKLGEKDEVFSEKTSIFFKTTRIYRLMDKPRNTIIYLAISTKISTVRRRMRSAPFRSCRGRIDFDLRGCALACFSELHRALQIHRDELRHAALGHGDAVEAIHPRHGDGIVGDDDKSRIGRARHLVEQIAEALDIVLASITYPKLL